MQLIIRCNLTSALSLVLPEISKNGDCAAQANHEG